MAISLGELAERLGARLVGDPTRQVLGVGSLMNAGPGELTFLGDSRYRQHLSRTRAAVVILRPADAGACPVDYLLSDNPYLTYALAAGAIAPPEAPVGQVHERAVIDPSAEIAASVVVGPLAVVGADCRLGERSYIGPGCLLGRGVEIGSDCRLIARVTVCDDVRLGDRVLVQPGAVIGSDGFGYAMNGEHWVRIPQLGSVQIGDDVDIGANTTIDRGAVDDTVVEAGVKLDNLIQVGHNVRIGAGTAIAGCVGIAGSTHIGRHCQIGGGAGFNGHIEVADGVHVSFMTAVSKSLRESGSYASAPLVERKETWRRNSARFRQLDQLARRLIALEKRLGRKEENQ